jgi:fatty-acyl-CoA synthase
MMPAEGAGGESPLKSWVRALDAMSRIAREPGRTLPLVIEESAGRFADAPAVLSDEITYTHRELALRCRRYSRWGREQGLDRGDVVGLLMENEPDYLAAWIGLTRLGVVVALINVQLRGAALAHALAQAQARLLIVGASLWDELAPELAPLAGAGQLWCAGVRAAGVPGTAVRAAADLDRMLASLDAHPLDPGEFAPPSTADPALLVYTSGTTGLPKAARVSHRRVMQWSHWFAGMAATGPQDRVYDCLPMYHSVGGIVAPGAALVTGGSLVVRRRFSASRFWSDVSRWDCTVFQYIGDLCRILLNEPARPEDGAHRLRLACGNGLAAEIWEPFRERFRIPRILEFYAATEANFSLYNCEGRPGSVGRVPPFFAHRFPLALVRHDAATGLPQRAADGRCMACAADEAGEAISRVAGAPDEAGQPFEGYTDAAASEAKILRDVFEAGDAWYRAGDLLRRDRDGFYYFVDRVGDTFRWRGENVSTTEVARLLCVAPGVAEALVYGVPVPGNDGRAGMAALRAVEGFTLDSLWAQAQSALPRYARPLFVRLLGRVARTATFKADRQALLREGFDPARVADPLYVCDAAAGRYVPLDAGVHERIAAGRWRFA